MVKDILGVEDQLIENTMRYKDDPTLFVLDFYVSIVAIHLLRDLIFMFLWYI